MRGGIAVDQRVFVERYFLGTPSPVVPMSSPIKNGLFWMRFNLFLEFHYRETDADSIFYPFFLLLYVRVGYPANFCWRKNWTLKVKFSRQILRVVAPSAKREDLAVLIQTSKNHRRHRNELLAFTVASKEKILAETKKKCDTTNLSPGRGYESSVLSRNFTNASLTTANLPRW